jgi:NADH-quinone oxidoreductase subunit N
VASYYYLRLIVVMYMREPVIAETPAPASLAMRLALVLTAIATIYLGVVPGRVVNSSQAGAQDLGFVTPGRIVYHIAQPTAPPTPER